jgi:uncharacterized integral membrane protein (TIGR00698 family)
MSKPPSPINSGLISSGYVSKPAFFIVVVLAGSGYISPPIALTMGLVFGLIFAHPYPADTRYVTRFLLQFSVVGLGFGMNLGQVISAGRSGFVYTAASISFALALGWVLGKMLRVKQRVSYLISAGTAICGGSAIAALSPILNAGEDEIAVSLATVFALNSVALLTFPAIGSALNLSQTQFGLWAALAIHDTSSVVGAAAKYGAVALAVGTTVKLARALWIVPLTLATALRMKSKARIQWPWFIALFCLAAVANTYLPAFRWFYPILQHLGILGLTVTLFLIGTGLSRQTLRTVGVRPLLQGILLWIVVAAGSLALILTGWIY